MASVDPTNCMRYSLGTLNQKIRTYSTKGDKCNLLLSSSDNPFGLTLELRDDMIALSGNTYPYRSQLRQMQGVWQPEQRAWTFSPDNQQVEGWFRSKPDMQLHSGVLSGNDTYAFRQRIKTLGGRWDNDSKTWHFNEQESDRVKRWIDSLPYQLIDNRSLRRSSRRISSRKRTKKVKTILVVSPPKRKTIRIKKTTQRRKKTTIASTPVKTTRSTAKAKTTRSTRSTAKAKTTRSTRSTRKKDNK